MTSDDARFLAMVSDGAQREVALRQWVRLRRWSFIAAGLFLLLSAGLLVFGAGPLCGLFAGVSAINFAAATSTDTKIKLALLAGRVLPPAVSVGERGVPEPAGEA